MLGGLKVPAYWFTHVHSRRHTLTHRHLIRRKKLMLLDIFRLFDLDGNGMLNCTELNSGLHWLGLTNLTTSTYT